MASSVFIDPNIGGETFSGQMVGPAADNTAAPPFSFLGDLTSGFGSSAAGTVDLVAAGASRFSISSTIATVKVSDLRMPNGANTEYGEMSWISNVFTIGSVVNGGSARTTRITSAAGITLAAGGSVNNNISSSGIWDTISGLSAAGKGMPVIVGSGRVTAQSAANASIATFTVGAADGTFEVSGNVNVSAAVALATTLTCTYTDESNTARSMILPITQLSGSFIAAGAITGTGAWESPVMTIRCKAATAITILTSTGTFTSVTYTASGVIKQLA